MFVASPDLLKKRVPLKVPADCMAFPLLHDFNRRDWPLWFEARGVAAPNCRKGLAYPDNHLIVRAAIAGQGLALVRDIYAEDDLRAKKLVRPLTVNWPVQFAYYAVATSEALQSLRFGGLEIGCSERRDRKSRRSPDRVRLSHGHSGGRYRRRADLGFARS
jgi:DNA-binding transcriptional LysR family regulator